jgi:hypothetical protein
MPFVYATYSGYLTTANPSIGNWKHSSTYALDQLLQALQPNAMPTAQERKAILETLGLIPRAKQLRYINALNYASANLGTRATAT